MFFFSFSTVCVVLCNIVCVQEMSNSPKQKQAHAYIFRTRLAFLLHIAHYITDGFLLTDVKVAIYQCFLSYHPFPSIKPAVQVRKGTEGHTHTAGTFGVGNSFY